MDPFTVIAILSFDLIVTGCLLLLIRERMPQGGGLGWFGLGSLMYGVSLIGRLKLGAQSLGLLSNGLDAAMLLAMLLFPCGLLAFVGRTAPRVRELAAVVAGYLLVAWLVEMSFGVAGRHVLLNAVLGGQQLAFVWLAVQAIRVVEPTLRAPLATLASLVGVLAALTLLRVLALNVGVDALFQGWLAQLYVAYCSFVGVLLGPLVLWMVFVRLQARLAELATHDPLTGLLNRAGLDELLRRHFRALPPLPVTVLQIDIDHFKRVNDAHGHAAGDHVLRLVAGVLARTVRSEDFAVRTGGEEFLVGCIAVPPHAGALLAERLRAAVAALPIEIGGYTVHCTISVGISPLVRRLDEWAVALHQADAALYTAKHIGRDCVVSATDPPRAPMAPMTGTAAPTPAPLQVAAALTS